MSAVPALCLAPDGWHLLSGGRDKVVCVWDIRNGSKVATLPVYEALEGEFVCVFVCVCGGGGLLPSQNWVGLVVPSSVPPPQVDCCYLGDEPARNMCNDFGYLG